MFRTRLKRFLRLPLSSADLVPLWGIDDPALRRSIARACLARVGLRPVLVTLVGGGAFLGFAASLLRRLPLPPWAAYAESAIVGAALAYVLYRWERRRVGRLMIETLYALGRCTHCGYKLENAPVGRCPECGTEWTGS